MWRSSARTAFFSSYRLSYSRYDIRRMHEMLVVQSPRNSMLFNVHKPLTRFLPNCTSLSLFSIISSQKSDFKRLFHSLCQAIKNRRFELLYWTGISKTSFVLLSKSLLASERKRCHERLVAYIFREIFEMFSLIRFQQPLRHIGVFSIPPLRIHF